MTHRTPTSRRREYKLVRVEAEFVIPTGVRIDELNAIKNWDLKVKTRTFDYIKPIIKKLSLRYKAREVIFEKPASI